MRVYLIKDLPGKGKKGDIIEVNDGYGKNFVIKNKYGTIVDNSVLNKIQSQRAAAQFHTAEEIKEIKGIVAKLESVVVSFAVPVGESGKMFGSVTAGDIAEKLAGAGFNIEKKNIVMPEPIKTIGAYKIKVKFGHQIEGAFKVIVEAK